MRNRKDTITNTHPSYLQNVEVGVFILILYEYILYPERKCDSTPDGVQLIFLWFIVLSLVIEKMSFNFALVIRQKNSAKKLYCTDGWWVDGRQFGSLNFPQF